MDFESIALTARPNSLHDENALPDFWFMYAVVYLKKGNEKGLRSLPLLEWQGTTQPSLAHVHG